MVKGPSLTDFERKVVKRLIADGERNQDVHVLVNIGRSPTVNFGRFSGSQEWAVDPATDEEISRFKFEKSLVDLRTGLSPLEDERLYKAREAMLLAVECFNNPLLHFKVEVFAVLSQIAWTYLIHEYYTRKKVPIANEPGHTLPLSALWERDDFPLQGDVRKNLIAMKMIRDDVEHRTLNAFGSHFYTLFQSNALNFEEAIRQLFGERLSLGEKLSLALQFSKMSIDQLALLQKFDVSPAIRALETSISEAVNETGKEGIHYKFQVHFSLEGSSKGNANIKFTNDNTKAVSNVLAQKVALDELWPFKPKHIVDEVRKVNAGFNYHHHTLAWKKFGVRPSGGAAKPDNCNKKYCTYNKAHKDYTYSQEWLELLSETVGNPDNFAELVAFKA